jgi:RimJ/RimL family protein N-acetyltransferase
MEDRLEAMKRRADVRAALRIIRHRVYTRPLRDVPASGWLPDGLSLRAVDYEECVRFTCWSQTGGHWYRAWYEEGAQCWLGWHKDDAVFKAWVTLAPRLITSVVPWGTQTRTPAYIFDVETRSSFRRKGLAKAFIYELMQWSRVEGVERVYVRVLPDNRPSSELFLDLGFVCEGLLSELLVGGRRVLWHRTDVSEPL